MQDKSSSTIQYISPQEAVSCIRSGSHIHLSSASQVPSSLLDALAERALNGSITDIHLHHSFNAGFRQLINYEQLEGRIIDQPFFVGPGTRNAIELGLADYIPVHLSETQALYRTGILQCDVAIISVSTPRGGKAVSLGGDVVCTLGALDVAKYVIAEVNPNIPFCFGDAVIPIERIDAFVYSDRPLVETHIKDSTEVEKRIGEKCAALIPDGSCIQMGIGSLPNAIAASLYDHKHLGMHTEMFSNGLMGLIKSGVIDGTKKQIDSRQAVASFVIGDAELFSFVNENSLVRMMDINYTNNPANIARNDNVVAINAAVQIDLSGQICADSVGHHVISGTGGQLDFIRGASMSRGGISIIALNSTTKTGLSKIVSSLRVGAGVVTPRASVQWVVTEYGAINLYGCSMRERANMLINIAHPNYREQLEREAFDIFGPRLKMFVKPID